MRVELVAALVFFIGFLTTYLLIPKLIKIIRYKDLMDHPDKRSSHLEKTPTLGGVTFFISLIFGIFAIQFFEYDGYGFNIVVGITILFFVGLKDDLMVLSPQTKILAEMMATSFVLLIPDLWITNLHGFFGIYDIPLYVGILLSYFTTLLVINAYNLMDGIDGLSGSLGTLIFFIFGSIFYITGQSFYFLLSVLPIAFLIAFLRFNVSKKNKIFMGDTGSLIVGFLIAIMTIRFLAMKEIEFDLVRIAPNNKFIIVLTILFFPVMDVVRVVIMRLLNKRGPFDPDRSHVHHIMVDKGLQHLKATGTIIICSIVIFCFVYLLNRKLSTLGLAMFFLFLALIYYTIMILLDSDKLAATLRKKLKSLFPRKIQNHEFNIRKKIIYFLKKSFYKDLV